MPDDARTLTLWIMGIAALLDALTTFLGLASIFRPSDGEFLKLAFCVGPSLVVLGLLLLTMRIWEGYGVGYTVLKVMWGLALLYDVWTSFSANVKVVLVGPSKLLTRIDVLATLGKATGEEWVAVGIGTVLVSASPIVVSLILED